MILTVKAESLGDWRGEEGEVGFLSLVLLEMTGISKPLDSLSGTTSADPLNLEYGGK